MRVFALALALGLVAFPALGSGAFDTSDVSLLLPLPRANASEGISLKISEAGRLGELFTQRNFERLPLFPRVFRDLPAVYDNTYITGVRIDACVPRVDAEASPKSCFLSLIRLVAQPTRMSGGKRIAEDAGIHLIYALKLDEAFVASLRQLKLDAEAIGVNTTGVALGVHPVLRGDYWNDPARMEWARKLKAFILRHAGTQAQIAASVMVTHVGGAEVAWEWSKVPFDPKRHLILVPGDEGFEIAREASRIATVEGAPFSQSFIAARGKRTGVVVGKSLKAPEVARLLDDAPPSPADAKAAYEQAHFLENPKLVTIPEADCVSCHVATPYRLFAEAKWGAVETANRFAPVKGITPSMEAPILQSMARDLYLVLNFGYVFEKPSVSQRTVNESVEVARFLNRFVAGR